MKYRKKPVIIEAVQYKVCEDRLHKWDEAPDWLISAFDFGNLYYDTDFNLFVRSLEGDHHVSDGDYIICGVKG